MSASLYSSRKAGIDRHAAEALFQELQRAHVIVHAMLQELDTPAKCRLAVLLEDAGISPDGMTRSNERTQLFAQVSGEQADVIAAALARIVKVARGVKI